MPPWWGKSSSKEVKKKTNKENFIDTLQRKLKIPSEEKRKIRSGGFQRCSSDIALEKGSQCLVKSRSPSLEKGSQCLVKSRSPLPSMHASRCQSFAERPNPQPLPLPTGHSSTGHTATGISMSRSEFEKCSKSPLILPHAKPDCIRKSSDAAYADVDLATASVSSDSLIDGDDPADSCLLSPQASDFENVLRTVANSPRAMHKDKSPAITRKNSRETLTTAHPFINNKSASQSPKKGLSTYPSNVQSIQHGGFETGSAPDSSMSSPSRSPMRAVCLEQIASYAFCSTKPYPDVSMFGSGQCSSQGSGQNSGHNSVGGDMSGQLFWQHSRGSTECSPIPSPRKTSPGPSSRIQSGAVTPLHPRAGGAVPESTSSRPEDGKKQSHRLPLPPLTICNSSPFSPSNSGVTASLPSVPRSPGRVENPSSPGSRWKRGRLIGRGTFGHVYVGFNSESGEMCAMKEVTLFPDDPKSKESAKQLMQEIALLSRLRHQNIVQYYGSETIEEKLYIYLEYVSGGSIHKLLQDYGQFGELAIRNFTQQILSGLAYLHAKNTVHRDIKGANILVDPNGHVKLADFGMAKHITGQSCSLSFKGSPNWMAPEVIKNSNGCSLAVDIWSLGCTVLEMATAKPPWSQYEGVTALFKIGNSKELPAIPDHLSDDGKDFVKQCLQRNPLQRPTAAQLLEHPFVKHAAPVGGSNARDHSSLDMEGLANHQPAEAKTSPVSREILLPRNISPPVSPLGSPLLHSKSPQFMNGRTSPSPISSPRTTSGSSTPLSGGSGSIPFHHLQQSAYLHKEFGGNMLMAPNSPHLNGSNYHDLKPNLFQMLLSGSHGLREMMASETDILMKPFGRPVHEDHLELYYGQSVLADRESQQLSRDHVKSNTPIGFGAGLRCCCPDSLM